MRRNTSTGRVRGTTQALNAAARQLRRTQTPAEATLWQALRGRSFHGLKFRRQHPLGPYVVDFYCPSLRLIIEVDGDVHHERRDYDTARTEHLAQYHYHVVRFRNEEVLCDLDGVLQRLTALITEDHPAATLEQPRSPG
ncbi:endonuclease domain-containing protein [Sphaerobacter thermophilus]|uniref:DUF559 domain-containing protein n=1 Tax=Sphaerobacter thermophilus (strain ATCC 49802 / DSM 20745 / KCCM 41009 / NCIMB 13125 / S 6022) TaxID=479434 RepID=D1C1E2_SPHTD|nr:endonuclease domain-containing protein [Sphaerobacter thermophilus]ACZ38059.1 protein of unknown function DUF559 [Sphaerobacter thermophilus DSM 20745]